MRVIDGIRDGLTYGEALQLEQDSMEMHKGVWTQTIKVINKAQPMTRKEAARYYNKKLFDYYKEQRRAVEKHKQYLERKLSYLMFRDPFKYKEL